jgi:hypothetical protein
MINWNYHSTWTRDNKTFEIHWEKDLNPNEYSTLQFIKSMSMNWIFTTMHSLPISMWADVLWNQEVHQHFDHAYNILFFTFQTVERSHASGSSSESTAQGQKGPDGMMQVLV